MAVSGQISAVTVRRAMSGLILTAALCLCACEKPKTAPKVDEDALPAHVMVPMDDSYMVSENTVPVAHSGMAGNSLPPEASKFISALVSDDDKQILSYQGFEDMYSQKGKLNPVERDHIRRLRPIIEEGNLSMKEIDREGHEFTVLFYQSAFADKIDERDFRDKEYLNAFFACRFDDSSGSWKLAPPAVCYSETSGPFG